MNLPVYVIIYLLNVPISVTGPVPYSLAECIESLKVLTHIPELETKFACVEADELPSQLEVTPEQVEIIEQATESYMNQEETE